MHAGIEYSSTYSKSQQRIAHASINAGADLVIGTHPHVVQPLEIYKNKAIFYSLGNFMFDQNFSFETTHGLAVRLTWGDNTTTYSLIPTTIAHQEASIASSSDAAKTLRSLFYTELPPEVISSITRTHSFTLK
jgi:poly-gamma-glutamate capsule biosynthesis protein CapA/YwtB (metallophosphatase superfamily)